MGRLRNFISGERIDATVPTLPPQDPFFEILHSIDDLYSGFTDIFLYGAIVPVIPFAIQSRAGVAQASVQSWVSVLLAVYGAALLVASPFAGWYADRSSSRRFPLLIGLLALAGATVMLCLARTVALLVVGRILQGLSAAIVWTVGQALLVDTVGQKEIGETLGWVSLSMSLGVLLAPLLGGVVYNKAGYYAVYFMAFGLIALDITLRLALIEKKIARQWHVDEEVTETEGISNPDRGSGDPENLDEKAVEAGQDREEITNPERRSDEDLDRKEAGPAAVDDGATEPASKVKPTQWPPILTLLKSRRLDAALWGCIVQGSLMTAFDSVIPLYVQQTFHWDSIGAGLVFLALIVPSFAAPGVGWVSDRYGPRWLTVAGFVSAIPFWILLRLVTYNSLGQKVLLCALMTLIGFSLTLLMPPLMAEITYVVEAKEKKVPGSFGPTGAYAQAYGLFVTAFAAGTLIGPIWAGYIRDAAGWGTLTWTLGLFSLSGAIPCLIWTGGLITRTNAKTAEERAVSGLPGGSGADGGENEV